MISEIFLALGPHVKKNAPLYVFNTARVSVVELSLLEAVMLVIMTASQSLPSCIMYDMYTGYTKYHRSKYLTQPAKISCDKILDLSQLALFIIYFLS